MGEDEKGACTKAGVDMQKFTDTLPTESVGGRQKRIDHDKARLQAQKEKRLNNKPLPFGHRRNGGGKKKNFEPTSVEVIAARRALRRHRSKINNKAEELKRAEEFVSKPPTPTKEVEYLPLKIQVEEELTEEEQDSKRAEQKYIWDAVTKKRNKDNIEFPEVPDKMVKEAVRREARREAKRVKDEDTASWTNVGGKSSKNIPKVIKMGAAPYRPYRPNFQTFTRGAAVVGTDDIERQKAFAKLTCSSSGEGAKSLTHTKMCLSVIKGFPCKHGDKCRFAHSEDQLQVPVCFFGLQLPPCPPNTGGFLCQLWWTQG